MAVDSNSMVLGAGIGIMVAAGMGTLGLGWAIAIGAGGVVLAAFGFIRTRKEVA